MAQRQEEQRQNWIDWAVAAFEHQREEYERFEDYYSGDHKLEFATERWKDTFKDEFDEFADNWCGVVVDALAQRMKVTGWDCDGEDDCSEVAQAIWEGNELEYEEQDLYIGSISKGDGYLMVWPTAEDDWLNESGVDMVYHDASDVNVVYEGMDRRRIVRAAKKWQDEDGQNHLRVYLPDRILQYFVPADAVKNAMLLAGVGIDDEVLPQGWQKEGPDILNPWAPVIPIFHFKNRRASSTHGISEIDNVIPVQNAVNKLWMDLMVGSEFGSFRQKWMAGAGHPKEGWKAGPSRVWATTDPSAKFGEFGQIDLEPLNRSIEMAVGHIAKITQTPMHYLRSSGDMPSGEALKTAESGLVKKAINRQRIWSGAWSQSMMFAFRVLGRNPEHRVYPIWQDAETRHDLEQGQVAQLKALLGIPLEQLWKEHFDYTDEQIAEFKDVNADTMAKILAMQLKQAGQEAPGTAIQSGSIPGNMNVTQLAALAGKAVTSQGPAGEATPNPQANTRPPASPTRRSSGFKD